MSFVLSSLDQDSAVFCSVLTTAFNQCLLPKLKQVVIFCCTCHDLLATLFVKFTSLVVGKVLCCAFRRSLQASFRHFRIGYSFGRYHDAT